MTSYFAITSTQEMLDEWRPLLCPFSSSMDNGLAFLEVFLPTLLDPKYHCMGFRYLLVCKYYLLYRIHCNTVILTYICLYLTHSFKLNVISLNYLDLYNIIFKTHSETTLKLLLIPVACGLMN